MNGEIPHFLFSLLNWKLSTRNESRIWFILYLKRLYLQKIKKYNANKIKMEIGLIATM
jgi:hypothetical protein